MDSRHSSDENNDSSTLKQTTTFLQKFFRQPDLTPKPDDSGQTKMLLQAIKRKIGALKKQRMPAKESFEAATESVKLKQAHPNRDHIKAKDGRYYGLRDNLSFYQAKKDFYKKETTNLESDIHNLEVAAAVLTK